MNRFQGDRRFVFVIVAVTAAFVVYLGLIGESNQAQERKISMDRSALAKYSTADRVTADIRNPANELVRVTTRNEMEKIVASRLGRVVGDHGSFVVLSTGTNADLSGSGLEVQRIETTINLPGARFDPIMEPQAETVGPAAELAVERNYYVVQFGGIITDEWLDSVRAMGGEVIQYVPHQAYFVYADGASISRVAENSRVRWTGAYLPEQKLSPHVREFARSRTKGGELTFDIAVFSRADLDAVALEFSSTISGRILASSKLPNNFFNVLRVEIPASELSRVAAMRDVFRVDPYIKPTREDERAAQIVAGNYTNTTTIAAPGYNPLSQFGVDGTNVTVAIVDDGIGIPGDGGFYVSSTNALDGPLRSATTGAQGHGHLQASIIAGTTPFSTLDPTGYNYGRGIAPNAHLVNIPLLRTGYTGTDADAQNDVVVTPGPNGVAGSISNNSWGAGTNSNAYGSFEAQFDGIARDASAAVTVDPLLIVFSAGNSGATGLTRPKMSKNTIAVGSSENLRADLSLGNPTPDATIDNIDDISDFSSRGPAADGRIKPDIVAPGEGIAGGRSGNDNLFGNIDAAHRWSSGTSHSAPQVAGAAALFTQWWKSVNGGLNPNPAITKAAILLSGQEMGGLLATSTLPNGNEGWGRINLKYILNPGVSMKFVDQNVNLLSPGDNQVYTGVVADPAKPVRFALVWTDPPGTTDPALVNNLDLTVNVGGTEYKGNVFTGGVSTSGGSADTINNVEQVRLNSGIGAGTSVTITINASALNGDGILGNGDSTDQHFAFVAYNFTEAAPTIFNVSGRVTGPNGRGISRARVRLDDGIGGVREAYTNIFGFYTFYEVPIGNYTASVKAKRYTFSSQPVNVTSSNITDLNFVATSGTP